MSALKSFVFLLFMISVFVSNIHCQVNKRFYRKDYTYLISIDNFYKVHTIHRTWAEAKKRCELEGAKLFYPQNANEAEEVVKFLKETQPFSWVLVGISNTISKEVFETIDGNPIEDVYNRWAPGEPNDADGMEGCVTLNKEGKLHDDRCDKKYPFICKKALADLEWNKDCDMPDKDYIFNQKLGKCYKFHLTPKNWTDAITTCSAEQSYLAIIESQVEADHLVQMTADAPKHKVHGDYLAGTVHLGFHKKYSDEWKTIKGVPLYNSGYAKWGGGQPDNRGGTEVCGSMFYDGGLNDMSCYVRCFFICEHDIGIFAGTSNDRFN
ncbi:macrophage mannose receptor 1-like [Hyposmocoma kahamanoa]|uniref:macrophage mannose receptor 1-like n=1 Tax=Hyposmocoma kahamanoa TaxID=1477025 RepID=UPI000E6D9389|nr:macrophage mannose receptor 1-like [Hyposmocoma kahamanoa]